MSSSLTELTITGCRALPNDTGNDTLYLEAMDKLPELRIRRGLSVLNDTKQCFKKEDDVMQALQKIKNSSGDLRVDVNSTAFVPICQHLVGRNETIMSTDVFINTMNEDNIDPTKDKTNDCDYHVKNKSVVVQSLSEPNLNSVEGKNDGVDGLNHGGIHELDLKTVLQVRLGLGEKEKEKNDLFLCPRLKRSMFHLNQ